jgi:phospholipid N-methyltransferase
MKHEKANSHHPFIFLQEFVKHPFMIGSVIPSSRYMERRLLKAAAINEAKTVVELGPGTGGTTKAILEALPPDAKLLTIEVNRHFQKVISRIPDERLIAHFGCASDLREILEKYHLAPPDSIISGIPFSTLPPHLGEKIIAAIAESLAPEGRFVAYQVSSRIAQLCHPHLGEAETEREFRNIPPVKIFRWQKNGHANP